MPETHGPAPISKSPTVNVDVAYHNVTLAHTWAAVEQNQSNIPAELQTTPKPLKQKYHPAEPQVALFGKGDGVRRRFIAALFGYFQATKNGRYNPRPKYVGLSGEATP